MKAWTVTDIRALMHALLIDGLFDRFRLVSLEAGLAYGLSIDGKISEAYLPEEDRKKAGRERYHLFGAFREKVAGEIRGRRMPTHLFLTLALLPEEKGQVLGGESLLGSSADSADLFQLNIRFSARGKGEEAAGEKTAGKQPPRLIMTASAVQKVFSLDKSLEEAWAKELEAFFQRAGLSAKEA